MHRSRVVRHRPNSAKTQIIQIGQVMLVRIATYPYVHSQASSRLVLCIANIIILSSTRSKVYSFRREGKILVIAPAILWHQDVIKNRNFNNKMKNKNQQISFAPSLMQQRQLFLINESKWCNNNNHATQEVMAVESTLIHHNKLNNKTNKINKNNNNLLSHQNSSTSSKLRWLFRQRIHNSIWVLKFILTSLIQHNKAAQHHHNKNRNINSISKS